MMMTLSVNCRVQTTAPANGAPKKTDAKRKRKKKRRRRKSSVIENPSATIPKTKHPERGGEFTILERTPAKILTRLIVETLMFLMSPNRGT
jgi:hypothetical protein